jgi:DNA invertase Pin-like site-specific DNA recombinase
MWSKYNKFFNGRASPTTDASVRGVVKYHDFIRFIPKNKENIYLKCLPLYEQGLSLSEVAKQTGFAKTSVRVALTSTGIPLRKNKLPKKLSLERQIAVKGGRVPYGHAYLEGKLLVDPKEYKIVLNIYRQRQKAQSYRAIARYLNDQGITTRAGKEWTNEIIKRIIDRHECDLKSAKNKIRKTK